MDSKQTAVTVETNELHDYKQKYKTLKRKLKGLVYEHELLGDQLERTQKKLLRVSRDRSFLLDRILQYEKTVDSSSDSEATDGSDSDTEKERLLASRKRHSTPPNSQTSQLTTTPGTNTESAVDASKKTPKSKSAKRQKSASLKKTPPMSIEDIEKHLDSRPQRPAIEKATTAMPTDIFSNVEESEGAPSDNEMDTSLIIDMK